MQRQSFIPVTKFHYRRLQPQHTTAAMKNGVLCNTCRLLVRSYLICGSRTKCAHQGTQTPVSASHLLFELKIAFAESSENSVNTGDGVAVIQKMARPLASRVFFLHLKCPRAHKYPCFAWIVLDNPYVSPNDER